MQSLRLLRELSSYSCSSSSSPGSPSPKLLLAKEAMRDESETDNGQGQPIPVHFFPTSSKKAEAEEDLAEPEKEENWGNQGKPIGQADKWNEGERIGRRRMDEGYEGYASKEKKRDQMEGRGQTEERDNRRARDQLEGREQTEERDNREEGDHPAAVERLTRLRLFPNEVVNELCLFLNFADCNRMYTVSRLFLALLEPRRKICMEVFIKRVDATRERLDHTIQEVNERRQHVQNLSEHIGLINQRLAQMGDHLANLDAQILDNHLKLDELHQRIERMKGPICSEKAK